MNLKEVAAEKTSGIKNTALHISGAMRNVMHKGELFGTIALDTISNKTHLYGLGPFEYLQGEILIDDGRCFLSSVTADGTLHMEESYQMKAPFFVYDHVAKWKEVALPDTVQNILQLESYLEQSTKAQPRPFAFSMMCAIDSAAIHIVNLPKGTAVHSPDDVQKHHVTFDIKNEQATLIGFFSTEHQGIFTHHDTYVHIHLMTDDHKKMGHLDHAHWQAGTAKLFLPG